MIKVKTYQDVVRKHAMKPIYVDRRDRQRKVERGAGTTAAVGAFQTDGSSRRIRGVLDNGGSRFLLPFSLTARGPCTATTTFGGDLVRFDDGRRERNLDRLRGAVAFAFCSNNWGRRLLYELDMNYVDNRSTYGRGLAGHANRGRQRAAIL